MQIYSSIEELSIYNYWKVITTGDLKWLIKDNEGVKLASEIKSKLLKAWEQIEVEMYEMQLEDPDYLDKLKDERDHYLLKIQVALENKTIDRLHYENQVDFFEKKEHSKFDFDGSLAMLEEVLHTQIDERKMTVKRYYTHLKRLAANGRKKN